MQNHKKYFYHFMVWMRNGIAYTVSWLLILLLIYNKLYKHQTISTDGLIKMVVWTVGAVFMVSICLYEGAGFYWLRIFVRKDTSFEWLAFIGIVLVLYLICIMIYQKHSKKQGEIYTQALHQYQQKRSMQNGK